MILVYPRPPKTVKQVTSRHQLIQGEYTETLPTKLLQ